MQGRTIRNGWKVLLVGVAGGLIGFGLVGCSRSGPQPHHDDASPAVTKSAQSGSGEESSEETSKGQKPVSTDPEYARLHQSFADATFELDPDDRPEWKLPDATMTGKSIGKIYNEVKAHWDKIKFLTQAGKPIPYQAVLETEQGTIEIALRPDLAPNHVRSFIALARAGYYDGLVFERTLHEQVAGQPNAALDMIEGGCPLGTGEQGYGSVGYWLNKEISDTKDHPDATHEEGVVGTDMAACKFYITLCKAPFMDGEFTVFGKVTKGLDVAKKILAGPVQTGPENQDDRDRPVKPVVIRKVTIRTMDVEKVASN